MNTHSVMLDDKLTEHFRRLNKYATRAQETVKLLPEFEWDVTINLFGDIEIYASNIAKAHDILIDAGFTNRNSSIFYFNNNCMVTLEEAHDRV